MKTAVKQKTCKNPSCRKKFTPRYSTLQAVCSTKCALVLSKAGEEKKDKARTAELREKLKTHGDYEEKLEEVCRAIAREIDRGRPCISCRLTTGKPQGGHFHSVGANNSTRYNLHNIHLQDFQCNVPLSSNRPGYEEGLKKDYGAKYLDYIKFGIVKKYPSVKLSREELITATGSARRILKVVHILQNGAEESGEWPDAKQRIWLRDFANERIGIYK